MKKPMSPLMWLCLICFFIINAVCVIAALILQDVWLNILAILLSVFQLFVYRNIKNGTVSLKSGPVK